jgi:hypothetical protein
MGLKTPENIKCGQEKVYPMSAVILGMFAIDRFS